MLPDVALGKSFVSPCCTPRRGRELHGADGGGDIVDSENVSTLPSGERGRGKAGRNALGRLALVTGDAGEEALPRRAHEHGPAECCELGDAGEQLERALRGLAEPD